MFHVMIVKDIGKAVPVWKPCILMSKHMPGWADLRTRSQLVDRSTDRGFLKPGCMLTIINLFISICCWILLNNLEVLSNI